MNSFKIIFFLIFLFYLNPIYAKVPDIKNTKQELNQIQIKINSLEKQLAAANNNQTMRAKELTKTNKKIEDYLSKLKKINQNINTKEDDINNLRQEINEIDTKLRSMQLSLAKYLTERYKLNTKEPIKWLANQNDIKNIDRVLVYYKYLVTANKRLMDDVILTKNTIDAKKNQLNNELLALNNLQKQLQESLDKLNNDKNVQATLMKKSSNDISKHQQTLKAYHQQQINLTKLINTLTAKSVLQTKSPLTSMRKKLIRPVNARNIQKVNQGLMFYAPEGMNVKSISPGKVVFSNWLNGYGLLIIIDHGWGFMSLYGNNLSLFKKVGDQVGLGEVISKIGHSGVFRENGLYFEIRHHGKAIPPLAWLQ